MNKVVKYSDRQLELLPEYAYYQDETGLMPHHSGQTLRIKRFLNGYFYSAPEFAFLGDWSRSDQDDMNRLIGVTKAQVSAMVLGYLHGWEIPKSGWVRDMWMRALDDIEREQNVTRFRFEWIR
jgi:hypothetical protein